MRPFSADRDLSSGLPSRADGWGLLSGQSAAVLHTEGPNYPGAFPPTSILRNSLLEEEVGSSSPITPPRRSSELLRPLWIQITTYRTVRGALGGNREVHHPLGSRPG